MSNGPPKLTDEEKAAAKAALDALKAAETPKLKQAIADAKTTADTLAKEDNANAGIWASVLLVLEVGERMIDALVTAEAPPG